MDLATGNLVKKNCYHINSDLGYLLPVDSTKDSFLTLRTYEETEKLKSVCAIGHLWKTLKAFDNIYKPGSERTQILMFSSAMTRLWPGVFLRFECSFPGT